MRSTVVYGPPACGKSAQAKTIARHFGLMVILGDGPRMPPTRGALILTNDPAPYSPDQYDIVAFADLVERGVVKDLSRVNRKKRGRAC